MVYVIVEHKSESQNLSASPIDLKYFINYGDSSQLTLRLAYVMHCQLDICEQAYPAMRGHISQQYKYRCH